MTENSLHSEGFSFELVQHTADMGLQLRSATLEGLLRAGRNALYSVIGSLKTEESPNAVSRIVELELTGEDFGQILRDYLAELHYYFDSEKLLLAHIDIKKIGERYLSAQLVFKPLDYTSSELLREIKAVTYHQLSVTAKKASGNRYLFEGFVIVDI